MANNNLEKYLEAILDKIADGTETDIPRPSWNIEKYLAAIYEALSEGGGGGGGGVLVVNVNKVTGALDKTWQEIHDADLPILKYDIGDDDDVSTMWARLSVEADGAVYYVYKELDNTGYYEASSPSEYPVYSGDQQ